MNTKFVVEVEAARFSPDTTLLGCEQVLHVELFCADLRMHI